MEADLFSLVSDYVISDLCQRSLQDHHYQEVLHLALTCRRFSRICRSLLATEYTRLCTQPPTKIEGETSSWYDSEGRLHRDGDLPALISETEDFHGIVIQQKWYQHGQIHRRQDRPAEITLKKHPVFLMRTYWQDGIPLQLCSDWISPNSHMEEIGGLKYT